MRYKVSELECVVAAEAVAYQLITEFDLRWDASPLETLRDLLMAYNITPKEQNET